jgi:hypothetical protein
MTPNDSVDSTREVASQDDFLFHLYRGSELLQDNRILEAKEALEQALTMQPLDPKGQDLLGTVYFRLGLYPRAIQIYEGLAAQFPLDVAIKINLALSYLKTGQPEPARRMLRGVVEIDPEHKRAWGYLGLALQKLGEFEQAHVAFEKGGRGAMARKLNEYRRSLVPPAPDSRPPEIAQGVRDMAQAAFSELDAGELRFALAEPARAPSSDGSWHTLELGGVAGPSRKQRTPAPKSPYSKTLPPPWMSDGPPDPPTLPPPSVPSLPVSVPAVPRTVGVGADLPLARLAPAPERGLAAVAPLLGSRGDAAIARRPSGVVVVQTGAPSPREIDGRHAFAGRLESLRVVAGHVQSRVLHRRTHEGETSEVLGGIGSPVVRIAGDAQVVVGPRPGHALMLVEVEDDLVFVREDLLVGFELALQYENGRVELGAAPGETVPVVQLRGVGSLIVEVPGDLGRLSTLEAVSGTPLLVRRDWVVAWFGRLVTRALPSTEAPGGHRGLIGFSGDGRVLVAPA